MIQVTCSRLRQAEGRSPHRSRLKRKERTRDKRQQRQIVWLVPSSAKISSQVDVAKGQWILTLSWRAQGYLATKLAPAFGIGELSLPLT